MTVTEMPKTEKPLAEIEPIRRLGEALRRGRTTKGFSLEEFSGKMGLSEVYVVEVERGTAVFDSKQCSDAAAILGLDYDLLLQSCQEWHKASWDAASKKPGFQLVETAAEMVGVTGTDPELEKMATEVLFTATAVAKAQLKMGHDLLQSCNRLQSVLIARGVLLPNPDPRVAEEGVVPSDGDNPQTVDKPVDNPDGTEN